MNKQDIILVVDSEEFNHTYIEKINLSISYQRKKDDSDEDFIEKINLICKKNPNKKLIILDKLGILFEDYFSLIDYGDKNSELCLGMFFVVDKNLERQKTIYNSSAYKFHLNQNNLEYIDHDFAKRQIDLTIYGSLIPTNLIIENPFKKDFKMFFGYRWLNEITKSGKSINVIPKILGACIFDKDQYNPEEYKNLFLKSQNLD